MPPSSEGSDLGDRELYSIPASSSWFRWDEIHDTERRALPEFFDGSAASRNPRVYKEYRDFIISKYREDPTRRIAFTEIRKSLIGDVGYLHKVFRCLEKWGLVNFGAKSAVVTPSPSVDVGPKVVVEEGAPASVHVVPACIPQRKRVGTPVVGGENGFKLPPLTSYTDVFADQAPKKRPVCRACGEQSADRGSVSLEIFERHIVACQQGGRDLCSKCLKDQANGKTAEYSKNETDGSSNNLTSTWTDAETLLLLEAVLKHGDDWDLIAQHVRTKNKLDCIARLIQLPFGEHILSSINGACAGNKLISRATDDNKVQSIIHNPPQGSTKVDGQILSVENEVVDESVADRPAKRRCFPSFVHAANSLMKQVTSLSTVAGPQIAAAAAEAAVTALCSENPSARKAFYNNKDPESHLICTNDDSSCGPKSEEDDKELNKQSEDILKLVSNGATAFQIRAAIATAMGAAAARAKLLADQEEREIELLMASIIEAQLRKIQYKIKHFEELETLMEKEYTLLQKAKESVLEEWMVVLEHAFKAGIPRWTDITSPKSLLNNSTS